MRRSVLAIASLTSAFVLSGCSYLNVGEENFSCSGMPGDPKCMSTSQMYQYSVDGGVNGFVLSGSGDKPNVVFGSACNE